MKGTFGKRLQYVMDVKKIPPKDVAEGIGTDRARISNWLNDKIKAPRRDTLQNLSEFLGCDIEWLASGQGEPFPPPKIETAEQNDSFLERRGRSKADETLAMIQRERFKTKCSAYFDEFFDFIGDYYGENQEAVDGFLREVYISHANYRRWLEEKKEREGNNKFGVMDRKSVNGKK